MKLPHIPHSYLFNIFHYKKKKKKKKKKRDKDISVHNENKIDNLQF